MRPHASTCIANHAACCNAASLHPPRTICGCQGIFLLIYLCPGPSAGVGGGSGNGKAEGAAGAAKFVEEIGAAASGDAHLKPGETNTATGVSMCLSVQDLGFYVAV